MKDNTTPLMHSSFYNDENTMKELIRLGADTNATDRYKLSPIAYAIENNSTKAVKTLLDSGAYLDLLNLSLQYYQESPSYTIGLDGIIIDGDNMILSYEDKYGDKEKHGFGDGTSVYGYIISHNFIEIMQILLEREYIHPTGKMSDCSPQEEFKCSFYNILDNVPNHEHMLNLLLDYNVSGQPDDEFLKKEYEKCYKSYKWHKKIKEHYEGEQRKIYFNLRFLLTKSMCSDENGTFKNIKHYIHYKNRRNLTNSIVGIIDSVDKVIFKNPTDTIYNDINFINGEKFIE